MCRPCVANSCDLCVRVALSVVICIYKMVFGCCSLVRTAHSHCLNSQALRASIAQSPAPLERRTAPIVLAVLLFHLVWVWVESLIVVYLIQQSFLMELLLFIIRLFCFFFFFFFLGCWLFVSRTVTSHTLKLCVISYG